MIISKLKGSKIDALIAAFPFTVPILAGFVFLGMAYGILMNTRGFSFIYPMLMSMTIFAGSMEFVTVSLLLSPFDPVRAFLLTIMVNARHLFYGISMLDKYQNTGFKKLYLIFGMCDESFSINYSAKIPLGIDTSWFMFFVTLLNHFYWVLGSTLGGIFGSFMKFNTEGLDFVMTSLFIVIFLEQWPRGRISGTIGVLASVICLIIFGSDNFIIPAMLVIVAVLSLLRSSLQSAGNEKDEDKNIGECKND